MDPNVHNLLFAGSVCSELIFGSETSWFTEALLICKDSALGWAIRVCSASSGETEAESPVSKMKVCLKIKQKHG